MNGLGLANGAAIGASSSHLLGGGGVGGGGSSYGVDSSHFSSMTHHHPAHSSQLTVIVPGENVKQVLIDLFATRLSKTKIERDSRLSLASCARAAFCVTRRKT